MNPDVREELDRLLSALVDGDLADDQLVRLGELLATDRACRLRYLEYVDVHSRLLTHPRVGGAVRPVAPSLPTRPVAAAPHRKQLPQSVRYLLVAASTLVASILVQAVWWNVRRPAQPPTGEVAAAEGETYVATLVHAADCVWDHADGPGRIGSRLLVGDLRLTSGVARLRFDGGPELTIEGPATVRMRSATAATVVRGKVVFKTEDGSAPFELRTPQALLADFGTEYAVSVGPAGEEVHVFEGEVHRTAKGAGEPERIAAGVARQYAAADDAGRAATIAPERFYRQVPAAAPPPADPNAGLLAYESFDYKNASELSTDRALGGSGWVGPWTHAFARPLLDGDRNTLTLNPTGGLDRTGAADGGSFDYLGFAKSYRRLAVPLRMNADGVYYLSYLFRRGGPQADPLNAVSVQLRTTEELENELRDAGIDLRRRMNFGVDRSNELFAHLKRVGTRAPLPLSANVTYLLVAKIAARADHPDQTFVRVYGPDEPVSADEPGRWSLVGNPADSDEVFDWLEVHVNSKTRQMIDEVRVGTTWAAVTAPWSAPAARK